MSASDVKIRLALEGAAEVNKGVQGVSSTLGGVASEAEKVGKTASAVGKQLASLAAAIGVAFTVKEFIEAADSMTLLSARLKLAAGSSAEFAQAQADVYRIAQANNVGLQETAQLYTKLSDPVKRLGGTTREVGAIVDSFATSLRVGGASTQEAAAATLQFAQAMGSGRLQGDEFRSIAEASPRFMKALAEGMNVPIEKLKEMGADGKLTADIVGNALVKSLGKLKSEAASLPDTVGGSLTRMRNDVLVAIADINSSSGLTLGLAAAVDTLRTEVVPAVKSELAGAFQTVGDFIVDNREQLGELWAVSKSLLSDVWEIAKAFGAVAGALVAVAIESGAVRTTFEVIRLLIAGLVDGADILAASLAFVGAQLLKIAGLFSDSARQMAHDAEAYAASVFKRFGEGGSAVAKLGAEMAKSAKDADAIKAALTGSGVSAADNARELRNASEKALALSGGYKTLKASTEALTEEEKKQSAAVKKLIGDLSDKLAAGEMEDAQQSKLTAGQKLALGVMEKLRDGTIKGTVAERQRIAALLEGILQQEASAQAEKDAARVREQALKLSGEMTLAELKNADAIAEQVSKQREHNATIGKTAGQLAVLERARLDDALATAEQNLQDGIRAGVNAETLAAITLQVEGLRELKALKDEGVIQQATADAAKAAGEAWQQTADSIYNGLTDSLYRAFESGKGFFQTFWDGIKNLFKTTVLKLGIQGVMQATGLSALAGQAGTAQASGGGILGSLGGVGSLLGSLGSLGASLGAFGTAAGYGASALFGGTGLTALSGGASMLGAGSVASGLGMMAGVLGPIAAGAGLLYMGLKRGKKETTGSGVEGTASAEGFSGTAYADWKRKGGFLRGTKYGRDSSAVDAGVDSVLDSGIGAAYATVGEYAKVLGLPVDAARRFSTQFKVVWGQTEEENRAAVESAIGNVSEQLAGVYKKQLKPMQKAGESLTQTMARLAGLQAFSEQINQFGGVFSRIAGASVSARENIISLAGGIEALAQKSQQFVSDYYSEGEQAGLQAVSIGAALKAAGIDASGLGSREQFRNLVESRDVSTEQGRQQLVALLDLAPQFAKLADYLQAQGKTLEDAAQTAPQVAMLQRILDQPQSTTNAVVSIGDQIERAVKDATSALQADLNAALAVIAANTAATRDQLVRWDSGGQMSTTSDGP